MQMIRESLDHTLTTMAYLISGVDKMVFMSILTGVIGISVAAIVWRQLRFRMISNTSTPVSTGWSTTLLVAMLVGVLTILHPESGITPGDTIAFALPLAFWVTAMVGLSVVVNMRENRRDPEDARSNR